MSTSLLRVSVAVASTSSLHEMFPTVKFVIFIMKDFDGNRFNLDCFSKQG